MLRPRIIPCLLIKGKGLVKTTRFRDPKYVGDPINAVRIFNEKEVDELIVLDVDATANRAEPDYGVIGQLAAECRMPFCYGGGVKTTDQAQRIIQLGVEKVAIGAAAAENPEFVTRLAKQIGSQSVVAVMDVKSREGMDEVYTHNGTRRTGLSAVPFARALEERGVGEIVVNSIDRDGMMNGYDLELAERVRAVTTVPLTVLGGAGSLQDIAALIRRFGIVGAAAGSLFVFKGVYRAVLINYPKPAVKTTLLAPA